MITTEGKKEQGVFALTFAPMTIQELEKFFNVKYPLPKLDMIAIPNFRGAMENIGLVIYAENALLAPRGIPLSDLQYIAAVITHENAHMVCIINPNVN